MTTLSSDGTLTSKRVIWGSSLLGSETVDWRKTKKDRNLSFCWLDLQRVLINVGANHIISSNTMNVFGLFWLQNAMV
jgi:hypothetical protein